jgi:hypothetical protein
MLSRMLGSGLADTVVLEVDGFDDPTAMENVVVTEPLADVLEGFEDSVLESDSSVVDSSSVARFCPFLL